MLALPSQESHITYPIAYPVPYRQEGIGYRLYRIQKYEVKVSGTSTYQYQLVPDTAKPCINPTLANMICVAEFWPNIRFSAKSLFVTSLPLNHP
ncbi:hypothetical protein AVEN_211112-1 [Araneus ventricosus]|uniref:Uncharacterized protein n=1 Tax=Araneus ventricosus TaxID=182803 RepID=A0A4Y2S9W9_ARAVE|nr:hypothetical protein AVEN_211112-1 [Araneus ventricosus]